METSKSKLDAKYANKEPTLAGDGTYAREVEAYKRSKEALLKRDRDLIDEEFQERKL